VVSRLTEEQYEESPDSKKPQKVGASIVPGGLPGAPGPARSPAEMVRDDLGRRRGPSEYQGQDPFNFGSAKVTKRPLPATPQMQSPMGDTLPGEKKGKLPAARTE
jgi:hypothetical protein